MTVDTARSIAVVGVGLTEMARRLDKTQEELVVQAIRTAADDAGLDAADIDGFMPASDGPEPDRVAVALGARQRNFSGERSIAGAASVGSAELARLVIGAGMATTVCVYYGNSSKAQGSPYAYHATDVMKAAYEMPVGWYGQPVYFAGLAQRYAYEHGLATESLAAVAMAARRWASLTPGAMLPTPLTHEEYLESPMIASPLRKADCCLINDGAAAYILTSLERARDLKAQPVVVAGAAIRSIDVTLTDLFTQNPDLLHFAGELSARAAFDQAGLQPGDVDLAEIYDCFSISTLVQLEQVGLCKPGEAAEFVRDGRIEPGGELPVNTHGGHLANSYLPGSNHVVEAVQQLRGSRGAAQVSGAEVALVAGMGGPDHATLLLTQDR